MDLTGKKFKRLTVIRKSNLVDPNDKYNPKWHCKCSCGKKAIVKQSYLTYGETKSCGCLNRDTARKNMLKLIKNRDKHPRYRHGQSKTGIHNIWCGMRQRCENKNCECYMNYGGRGIRVCKRWQKFENFLADMGQRPSSSHQIERIDNNGHYCPANCKWVERKYQGINKRNNHNITFQGKTQCLSQWAREVGITPRALLLRLKKNWTVKRALTTPLMVNQFYFKPLP